MKVPLAILTVFSVWLLTLGAAWLFAPASAAYPSSNYWTWVLGIWILSGVGLIRGVMAFYSSSSSQDTDSDEDDDDIGPSLLVSDQHDISKNF